MKPVVLLMIGAGVCLLAAILVLLLSKRKKKEDRPYRFRRDELSGLWVTTDGKKTQTLLFDRMMVTCGEDIAFYETPDGFPEDKELREILWTDGTLCYHSLMYHADEIGGAIVGILSALKLENPGRGLYVAEEYVRRDRRGLVPAGYLSPFARQLNGED